MMRRRSSSRCSRKLIPFSVSWESLAFTAGSRSRKLGIRLRLVLRVLWLRLRLNQRRPRRRHFIHDGALRRQDRRHLIGCPSFSAVGNLGVSKQLTLSLGRQPLLLCGAHRRFALLGVFLDLLFQLNLLDLVLYLGLELVAGTAELAHEFPHLARDLRQLSRPENQQREQENEDHLAH